MENNVPVFQQTKRLFFLLSTLVKLIRQRSIAELINKAFRLWRRAGIRGMWYQIEKMGYTNIRYDSWIKQYDTLNDADRSAIRSHIPKFTYHPLISVIMPTYNSPEKWLRRAIESVRNQLYSNWELCIADDASTQQHVRTLLEEYQRLDSRIRVVFRKSNGHISAASNSALQIACGDFFALLDHDDEFPEHALYMVASTLNDKPDLDLIYSDEDKIDEKGQRFDPYFKPDWNPDLLTGQNIVSHLGVYRTTLVRSIGGFREGYEGAQDWDLTLRLSEIILASHIYHIPHILYHWRSVEGSTAVGSEQKPYAIQAAQTALCDHLKRTSQDGLISSSTEIYLRASYTLPSPTPLVSIIIPTRNGLNLLRRCVESLNERTQYPRYEILVVNNQSDDKNTLTYLDQLEATGTARILQYDLPFNYSAINNYAVKAAQGEFLCLMNNDIEVISEYWLDEMVSQAGRPGIGAVGAKLYYPNDTIQHAGVILGMGGVAGHLYAGMEKHSYGYRSHLLLVRNVSAVTAACLVVKKIIYEEVSGFDDKNLPIAFNDVDFCLRLLTHGYRNLWTPFAQLYHHESATRGLEDTPEKLSRFQQETGYMQTRWCKLLPIDPAYNPNLALDSAWPNLAPPRVKKPWERFP